MLCTRIRLNERRIRMLTANHLSPIMIPEPTNELAASDGPFIRPCALPNVINSCSSTTTVIGNGTNSLMSGAPVMTTVVNTPRSSRSSGRLSSSTGQNAKTPLVVVTLYIPPDIQTLAPKEIKRDPRKQPSYCQNFKSSSSFEKGRSSPEFFIKGYEIIDKSSVSTDVEATVVDHETEDDGKNERNDTCCTCMVDDERYNNSTDDDCTLMTQNELLLNFDDYEMDAYGHLPGDSRTPTPTPIRKYIDGKSRCRITALRASSPSTGQVIRVTMNNKNQKRR